MMAFGTTFDDGSAGIVPDDDSTEIYDFYSSEVQIDALQAQSLQTVFIVQQSGVQEAVQIAMASYEPSVDVPVLVSDVQYDVTQDISNLASLQQLQTVDTSVQNIVSLAADVPVQTVDSAPSLTTAVSLISTQKSTKSTVVHTDDGQNALQTESFKLASSSSDDVAASMQLTTIASTSTGGLTCVDHASNVAGICMCDSIESGEETLHHYCAIAEASDLPSGCVQSDADPTRECAVCPKGQYCSGNTLKNCQLNAETLRDGAGSMNDCVCSAGFSKVESGNNVCFQCGHTDAADSSLFHVFCPLGESKHDCDNVDPNAQLSADKASSSAECFCKDGYYRVSDHDLCKPCPKNFYCPPVSDSFLADYSSNPESLYHRPFVYACPAYSITLHEASSKLGDCVCEVGFKVSFDEGEASCLQCNDINLCTGHSLQDDGTGTVTNCCPGEGACSKVANDDHSECVCAPGFQSSSDTPGLCESCPPGKVQPLKDQDYCQTCSAGTYSFAANEQCVNCPVNTESVLGADVCTCKIPYVQVGSNCELCTGNKFYDESHFC